MLRAVVFDFDGVIANSEPLHFRAFRDVLAGEGISLTEADYYARYLGYNDERAFHEIGAEHGRPWDATTVEWQTPTPPPHGNFDKPIVAHRGPYEYSVPGQGPDFVPQNQA